MSQATQSLKSGYTADSITVLEGLAAVRVRPAMYIGSTDSRGLHHLVYEVVDNSIDEAMAGFCTKITVRLLMDGSCSVSDNGRGIPVDIHPKEGVPAVQVVMTKLHAGGKFDNDSYKVSGGLHGVGVSCVNALSEMLEVTIRRDGHKYRQRYARGIPQEEVQVLGESEKHGTTVVFVPDEEIFETLEFSYEVLRKRFEELAYLNKEFIMPAGAVTIKAIFEEITTPPTPSEYTITSGANQSWRKGTIAGVTITSDGDFAEFIGIKVDGVLVDITNYTAISGSTVVSLKASYLETLTIGAHTVELVFADGTAQTELTILNANATTPTTTPNNTGGTNTGTKLTRGVRTGDSSNLMLYVGLFTLASAVIVVLKKRKKQSFK